MGSRQAWRYGTVKTGDKLFALLWGVNFLLSVGYYLLCVLYRLPHKKKEEKTETAGSYALRMILMILCPVLGPVYFGCSFLMDKIFWRREIDLSDVVFKKEKARTYATVDEERERNLASIEETMNVGDQKNLRTLMLNVLRGNLEDSLGSIAMALNSKDSETSHYAASVLRDELNDFRIRVQKIQEDILQEPEEETSLEVMLFDYISRILRQKVFSDLEQRKYAQTLAETAEYIYRKNAEEMTAERYESLCDVLRNCQMTENAEMWTTRLTEQYPKELAAYTSQLKLAFQENDRERFFEVLTELKQSDIVIDKETLELIRMFG